MSSTKSNDGQRQREPDGIERAALDWLVLLDRGITPEQEAEFERWLAADARHAQMFSEFDGTWALLNRVRQAPEAVAAARVGQVDADAFAPVCPAQARVIRFPRWRSVSLSVLGAAAALAIAYVGWWRPAQLAAGRDATYADRAVTDLGGLRKLDLPDGSVLQLNTDSAVDVQFTKTERRVRLTRGEAHFTVAKNPARPFIVSVMGVDVRAVGTAFNVRLRSSAVEVLVTEGKVRVEDDKGKSLLPAASGPVPPAEAASSANSADALADRGWIPDSRPLSAGERITIQLVPQSVTVPVSAAPVNVLPLEIERALAWQERRLEFVSVPLAEMVAEFNRYNRQKLVIAGPGLAAQHFGGTFRPDDPAGFVHMLEANFGIVAERRDGVTVLRPGP